MSYSVAYLVPVANGPVKEVAEFRNSHGFGPFVWGAVTAKWLPGVGSWLSAGDEMWPLWKDMRLPRHWRAALLTTYDYAIIEQARFKEWAGYLRQFVTDVGLRDRACHFLGIADLLDKHADSETRGMCFYGTSIVNNWWRPYDSEKDETLDYNFDDPEGKHYYVGKSLDDSESPPAGPSAAPLTRAAQEEK